MIKTQTTYHDIEPYAIEGSGMVSARCRTHSTATAEKWDTFPQAARGFMCDQAGARFVTEFHGDDIEVIPVMRDLSGLARVLREDAEAAAYGEVYGATRAWQWHQGGHAEPLTITLCARSNAGQRSFGEDDYMVQTWRVTGEDGRVVTEVTVRIDGRS